MKNTICTYYVIYCVFNLVFILIIIIYRYIIYIYINIFSTCARCFYDTQLQYERYLPFDFFLRRQPSVNASDRGRSGFCFTLYLLLAGIRYIPCYYTVHLHYISKIVTVCNTRYIVFFFRRGFASTTKRTNHPSYTILHCIMLRNI